ncbi:hypothetical protein LTR22_027409, partial [Elasticomyces elasticus]
MVGTARVMSYDDLEKVRFERAIKEADRKAPDKAKKAKEAKHAMGATPTVDEVTIGKKKRGRERKNGAGSGARVVQEETAA